MYRLLSTCLGGDTSAVVADSGVADCAPARCTNATRRPLRMIYFMKFVAQFGAIRFYQLKQTKSRKLTFALQLI